MIYGVELVQFCLRENAERRFMVALAFHIPVVVSGLISQYGFAESIKPALFAIVAGDSFHLLTPFLWGMLVVLSLSANKAFATAPATR